MNRFTALGPAIFLAGGSLVHADATLVYQLEEESAQAVEKTFSVSRFFVRVDSSDEDGKHLLFQAGKFFPVYSVNEKQGTYTRLTPPVEARLGPVTRTQAAEPRPPEGATDEGALEPSGDTESASEAAQQSQGAGSPQAEQESEAGDIDAAAEAGDAVRDQGAAEAPSHSAQSAVPSKTPQFKPTAKMDEVAGVRCRIVFELVDGEWAVEHCMANTAALGITERESRTLARLFVMARERGYDWLGAATEDEDFVSVRSRDLERGKTLTLESVSTKALPVGHLRVPKDFKEVELEPSKASANEGLSAQSPPQSPVQKPTQDSE